MTTRETFRDLMAQRRNHGRDTIEHQYMTNAGRKLVWIIRGVPSQDWPL